MGLGRRAGVILRWSRDKLASGRGRAATWPDDGDRSARSRSDNGYVLRGAGYGDLSNMS